MCMRGMRPFPQGVDHPDVQPVVQRQHIGRYIVEISGISNGMAIMREAESGGEYLAMGLIGAGDADVPDAQSVGQRMGFDRRVIAMASRSEECRVGKACVSTGRSRWSMLHKK